MVTLEDSARGKAQPGFTLIEVLVASLILSIALVALSSLFVFGIKNNSVAKEDTIMAALAQAKLESLKDLAGSTLDGYYTSVTCRSTCSAGCLGSSPCCSHLCYEDGCATADQLYESWEDPIVDPNKDDDVNESLYVRKVEMRKVYLGEPVGCVRKVTVKVGSRNGLLAPKAPGGGSWTTAPKTDVIGSSNPRRIIVSMYR